MITRLPLSCLGLALLATVALQAFADPLTPLHAEDVFEIEQVSDPQLAPDGRSVVYVRQLADVMTDMRYSNLWIASVDGRDHRPLTTGKRSDSRPRWSPDGRRLAWVSEVDDKQQIVIQYMDTGQIQVVTNVQTAPGGVSWSPDGTQLAFVAIAKEPAPKVATLPSPPEGAKWAEPPQVIDRLVYRFNAQGYLPNGYHHVFVVPAEGGTPRQLTSGRFHHGIASLGETPDTLWTRDGSVLIVANRRDDWELEPFDSEIYELDVRTGALKALTDRRGPDMSPALSPDGRRIAYLGYDDRYQGYQLTRLYVMNRDGSGARAITSEFDRDFENPVWAADGTGLYFAFDEEGESKLGFATLDGRIRTVARQLGSALSAYGGGALASSARDGTLAFTHATPTRPGDVAVLPRGAAAPRVVTAVNDDLLGQRRLGAVESFWYESSLDNRRCQGWLIKPPDFDASKKYPLILEIHGGPFANYGERFDLEKQVWAGMGYVVAYLNPRGSTSYGEAFGNLIHHAYPGDDFHDLNSGVDAVIARGFVDPDQLFVGGGSGGGVLTAWMIGRTTRFRAAVSYYPVIDWTSWALTSDIPIVGVKYWFPGNPWDHREHYDKRSLLSVVKNVKTPTMVITGEEDWRTPMSESEQYYAALKLLGVEAVLVRVPGEPHGIRRRPSHHVAKILEIGAWYDRHRKK
ncbi:MAG TPA: S9 family peptidase [Vicinamibacteria bacterium]|nr:S9 family peptidase [Vicinamibacteria bacterium]